MVGGVESWLLSLAKEWARSGQVEIVGIGHIGTEGTHQHTFTRQLTKVCPVVTSCDIEGSHKVRSPVDAAGAIAAAADVLIVWSVSADILARVKRPGLIIAGVSHGCHDWWMGAAAPLVDRWAAVDPVAVAPVPAYRDGVEIIPNGIDLERCQSSLTQREARRRLGLPPDGKVVGYVGRLSPEKRIAEIAASAAHLPSGWRVLIVGDGREADTAVGEWVYRRPATEAIGDVWRACDVAVVASEAEGYCLAAVEALAAGVPLAATRVGVVEQIANEVEIIPQPAKPGDVAAACVRAESRGISPGLAAWVTEQSAAVMASRWAAWLGKIASHPTNG
jgi:glycosyltransferase involved in cell wall biosynthesis